MSDIRSLKGIQQNFMPVQTLAPVSKPLDPIPATGVVSAVESTAGSRGKQVENLLEPQLLTGPLEAASATRLRQVAQGLPQPSALSSLVNPYAHMSNETLLDALMHGSRQPDAPVFKGILRQEDTIARSGVLEGMRELATRQIEVPASEYDRSVKDDAVLVMRDFSKLTAQHISKLKEQAYQHAEVAPHLEGALAKNYYGSPQHKAFGAVVEQLTGGLLSAEEAMSMSPCGGIPGPGPKEVLLIHDLDAIKRHAIRHDALGFLLTRFGVGPGYGSKTSIFGLAKDNPLAGQILGIAREVFHAPSMLSSGEKAATPERFQAS